MGAAAEPGAGVEPVAIPGLAAQAAVALGEQAKTAQVVAVVGRRTTLFMHKVAAVAASVFLGRVQMESGGLPVSPEPLAVAGQGEVLGMQVILLQMAVLMAAAGAELSLLLGLSLAAVWAPSA
jgi:hypothetical protein